MVFTSYSSCLTCYHPRRMSSLPSSPPPLLRPTCSHSPHRHLRHHTRRSSLVIVLVTSYYTTSHCHRNRHVLLAVLHIGSYSLPSSSSTSWSSHLTRLSENGANNVTKLTNLTCYLLATSYPDVSDSLNCVGHVKSSIATMDAMRSDPPSSQTRVERTAMPPHPRVIQASSRASCWTHNDSWLGAVPTDRHAGRAGRECRRKWRRTWTAGRCVRGIAGCCPSEGHSHACRTLVKIILQAIVFLVIVGQ